MCSYVQGGRSDNLSSVHLGAFTHGLSCGQALSDYQKCIFTQCHGVKISHGMNSSDRADCFWPRLLVFMSDSGWWYWGRSNLVDENAIKLKTFSQTQTPEATITHMLLSVFSGDWAALCEAPTDSAVFFDSLRTQLFHSQVPSNCGRRRTATLLWCMLACHCSRTCAGLVLGYTVEVIMGPAVLDWIQNGPTDKLSESNVNQTWSTQNVYVTVTKQTLWQTNHVSKWYFL